MKIGLVRAGSLGVQDDEQGGSVMYAPHRERPGGARRQARGQGDADQRRVPSELCASGATRVDVLRSYPHLTA